MCNFPSPTTVRGRRDLTGRPAGQPVSGRIDSPLKCNVHSTTVLKFIVHKDMFCRVRFVKKTDSMEANDFSSNWTWYFRQKSVFKICSAAHEGVTDVVDIVYPHHF